MSSRVVVDHDFNTKTLDKRIKERLEVGMVGKKSWGRINWPIYTTNSRQGAMLIVNFAIKT
jgi:hypothetical protein